MEAVNLHGMPQFLKEARLVNSDIFNLVSKISMSTQEHCHGVTARLSSPVHLLFRDLWLYEMCCLSPKSTILPCAATQRWQLELVLPAAATGRWRVCILSVYHKPSEAAALSAGLSALRCFSSYTGRHMPVLLPSWSTLFLACGILACCFWKIGNHMTCPTHSHCSSLSRNHRLYNEVGHMLSVKYLFQPHMEWRFHWGTLDCNFYWGLEWNLWQMCYSKI